MPVTPVTVAVNVGACPDSTLTGGTVRLKLDDEELVELLLEELEELVEDDDVTNKVKDPEFARLLGSPW